MTNIPASWDDTKLLSGYPGEDIVIARRKRKTWYVAGLNGMDEEKTLLFDPSMLNASVGESVLIQDGAVADRFVFKKGNSSSVKIP